jgi:hypothetical protein
MNCARCGIALFCSVACQRAAHSHHKYACKAIAAAVVIVFVI